VEALDAKEVEQRPKAPFSTSKLLQAADAQLGFPPEKTMELAQKLFEAGAITYHRTDSVALSDEAVAMAREFLSREHPAALAPAPVVYRSSSDAQGAHEAIRPTAMQLEDVSLSKDEELLFSLISMRFLASQCRPAVLLRTTVRTEAGGTRFVATGRVVVLPSFLAFLADDEEKAAARHEEGTAEEGQLPKLALKQGLTVASLTQAAETTKPKPRFTKATLVDEMERSGIGRPSTYSATVALLFERSYLELAKKAVVPTQRGRLVDGLLGRAFGSLVDTAYTAALEQRLDEIAAGKRRWRDEVRAWYGPFEAQLQGAPGAMAAYAKANAALVAACDDAPKGTGKPCPKCGKELLLRHGAKGAFLACSGYPACGYTADPTAKASSAACPKCAGPMETVDGKFGPYTRCVDRSCGGKLERAVVLTDKKCPRCSSPMADKGSFFGCTAYPTCKGTLDKKALAKAEKSGRACPQCQKPLLERKSSRGPFLGCSGYPACKHAEPLPSKAKR
jgi:DNA topoisomerase-1